MLTSSIEVQKKRRTGKAIEDHSLLQELVKDFGTLENALKKVLNYWRERRKKMFEYFTKKRIKFGYDFKTDSYKDIVVSESTTAVYNSEKSIRGQSHEHEKNHFADIQNSSPKCDYPAGQICLRCHNPIPYEYCRNCNQLSTGLMKLLCSR